ncbi:unnamed protein product [Ilex paraguariensis]|uniref:Uncharacterized protein n=1 Tax=Ilex paraguariensis TaxID=185542 RepID=A0ABC8QW64_9AQUA
MARKVPLVVVVVVVGLAGRNEDDDEKSMGLFDKKVEEEGGHVLYFLYFLEFILNVHIYRLFFPQVSTMPNQALQAFIDHDTVARTIDLNVSEAEGIYNALEKLAIDWSHVGS